MREAQRVEFESVFRSTYPSVLQTCGLILQDRARAEDVTQDAFVRLFQRWRGVVKVEHPSAWVRQVAVRSAVRQAKLRRLRFTAEPAEERGAWDDMPDVDLERAVALLPPRQRAVVALFYLEDLSVEDVAFLLEVSPSTVKQHLHRARARLGVLLSEVDEKVGPDVD